MQSIWDQGRNECDDHGRENSSACDNQNQESSREREENQESSCMLTRPKRERERESELGTDRSFIAPGAGGAKEPHVRSSEAAWDQLLGHVRSYEQAPCQPLGDSPAAPTILLPAWIFTHLILPAVVRSGAPHLT